jgi:hypothetical protein
MTTRQDIRNLCRRRLGDTASPYQWSDLQVNQWINDAIAELSMHFPRKSSGTITCSDDDRTYDLPFDFLGAVSVEYPTGEDPPEYLQRKPYTGPNFWDTDGCYDIMRRDDQSNLPEIWITDKPSSGENIELIYLCEHALLDDDSDTATILDRHLELIVLFVRWCCYQELATEESADPDPTSLSLGTLELNAFRAKREYRIKLKQISAAEAESASATWRMDKHDRVY